MDISSLVTITGKPGLFKVLTKSNNSLVLEELTTGRKLAVAGHNKVSLLESIGIFTTDGELPLNEVFYKIAKKLDAKVAISPKSSGAELREFMQSVLPEYDEERVYESHIKKLISWYNLLVEQGIITPESIKAYEDKLAESNKDENTE